MTTQKNEVVKTENKMAGLASMAGIVLSKPDQEGIGAGTSLQNSIYDEDRIIPKLRLQQRTAHNFVEEVPAGHFLNSLTGENYGKTQQIVIINSYKIWETFHTDVTPREWIKSELMTKENAAYDFEGVLNSRPFNRRNGIYFTCIRVEDLKKGLKRPFIVDFFGGNTSKPAGRQLVTSLKELHEAGAFSFSIIFELGLKIVETDNGPVYAKTVAPIAATPEKAIPDCIAMFKDLKSDDERILMDERDVIKDNPTDVPVSTIPQENEDDWANQ